MTPEWKAGTMSASKLSCPMGCKAKTMSSNCYSDKSPICIEKGMGSALVIFSAVVTLGSLTAFGLWAEIGPFLGTVLRLVG